LRPAQSRAAEQLARGGDLCAALGGNNLNFGSANPNTTTVNPDILGGWGVRHATGSSAWRCSTSSFRDCRLKGPTTAAGGATSS
jgi:hypothetical protein